MTTYFVTRHPGALEWAEQQGFQIDQRVDHLDADKIVAGDTVMGSLPVNLAATVCKHGGRYFHLSIDLPAALRGKELTAFEMENCNARIEEYVVQNVAMRGAT